MINTIQQKIIELLRTIPEITEFYDYPESNPKGYPYVFVTWEGNESEVLTNREDRVSIIYKITMVQEKLEEFKGRENAERTTKDRAWKIETLFRENNNLGLENVLRVLPIESRKTYDANATRIILEVLLRVQIIAPVTI